MGVVCDDVEMNANCIWMASVRIRIRQPVRKRIPLLNQCEHFKAKLPVIRELVRHHLGITRRGQDRELMQDVIGEALYGKEFYLQKNEETGREDFLFYPYETGAARVVAIRRVCMSNNGLKVMEKLVDNKKPIFTSRQHRVLAKRMFQRTPILEAFLDHCEKNVDLYWPDITLSHIAQYTDPTCESGKFAIEEVLKMADTLRDDRARGIVEEWKDICEKNVSQLTGEEKDRKLEVLRKTRATSRNPETTMRQIARTVELDQNIVSQVQVATEDDIREFTQSQATRDISSFSIRTRREESEENLSARPPRTTKSPSKSRYEIISGPDLDRSRSRQRLECQNDRGEDPSAAEEARAETDDLPAVPRVPRTRATVEPSLNAGRAGVEAGGEAGEKITDDIDTARARVGVSTSRGGAIEARNEIDEDDTPAAAIEEITTAILDDIQPAKPSPQTCAKIGCPGRAPSYGHICNVCSRVVHALCSHTLLKHVNIQGPSDFVCSAHVARSQRGQEAETPREGQRRDSNPIPSSAPVPIPAPEPSQRSASSPSSPPPEQGQQDENYTANIHKIEEMRTELSSLAKVRLVLAPHNWTRSCPLLDILKRLLKL